MTNTIGRRIVFLVVGAVLITHFMLIYKFALNVPDWDDYDSVLRFANNFKVEKSFSNKLASLFTQHNEHRIFFNRIVGLLSMFVFGVINLKFFIFIGNLSLVLVLVLLAKAFYDKNQGEWFYFLPIPFFVFSLASYENFLWAMASVQNISVILFSLASIYFLLRSDKFVRKDFIIACSLALLATYTSGNGLLSFVAGFCGLLVRRRPVIAIVVWFLTAALAIFFYSRGYVANGEHPDPIQTLIHKPDQLISHFFVLLGCITGDLMTSVFLGFLVTVVFVYLIVEGYYIKQPVFFFMLVFLILSSCMVSLSRAGFGVGQAMAVRYRLYSELIILTIYLVLIPVIRVNAKRYLIVGGVLLGAIVSYGLAIVKNMPAIQGRFTNLKHGAAYYNEENSIRYVSFPDVDYAGKILAESKALGVFVMPDISYKDIQSRKVNKTIPEEETYNIKYDFGFSEKKGMLFIDNAWAFVEGRNTASMKTFVVFRSDSKTYVFDTKKHLRNDVSIAFNSDVPDSGFTLIAYSDELIPGEYRIGLLIELPGTTAFEYTDRIISVSDTGYVVKAEPVVRKPRYYLDAVEVGANEVSLRGWVFVPDVASDRVGKEIIFKSPGKVQSFIPTNEYRVDVSRTYAGAYDSSGFTLHIPRTSIGSGEYLLQLKISYDSTVNTLDTERKIRIE